MVTALAPRISDHRAPIRRMAKIMITPKVSR